MQFCCDLEVDVNGEETFFVDKKILASFSGRLDKFINKLSGNPRSLKVIFHDFPGGADGFELIVMYCYNRGKVDITPRNVLLLHFAANFMEMNEDHYGEIGLIHQTKTYLKRVHCFTWLELLSCLKQCQKLLSVLNDSRTLQHILECLVDRAVLPHIPSRRPSTSSSDSSSVEFSGDISIDSTRSTRSYNSQTCWWFKDLQFLSISLLEKVVETMISQNLDHVMISSFLFYYQRVKFLASLQDEKSKIIKTVINLLCLLDVSFIPLKGLLRMLQAASTLKLRDCWINKLESMIGYKLDEASVDDLLVPSHRKSYAYDVNLVLRLLKHFLSKSNKQFFIHRLKKVACLMDSYIVEVAPDPGLKPSKFVVVATALPDSARDSHDRIYEAIDLYLKVHYNLCEEEKITVCCALNYEKLSSGSLIHQAQNANFPGGCAGDTALVSQQAEFRTLDTGKQSRALPSDMPMCYKNKLESRRKCRKFFWKMQTSKTHSSETRLCSLTEGRSLPALCR